MEDTGYFDSKSLIVSTWREKVLLLGATRALLLQLAHPKIAAGVLAHSSFQEDPVKRLNRTTSAMMTVVFGKKSEADQTLKNLKNIHLQIKGKNYSASDPKLKFWVLATLIDTTLVIYELLVKSLSIKGKENFYKESKILDKLFGVPDKLIPPSFIEFENYLEKEISSGEIKVLLSTKKAVKLIIKPKIFHLKPIAYLANLLASATMPPRLRKAYGLKWNKFEKFKFHLLVFLIKNLLPFTPSFLRFDPKYRNSYSLLTRI